MLLVKQVKNTPILKSGDDFKKVGICQIYKK